MSYQSEMILHVGYTMAGERKHFYYDKHEKMWAVYPVDFKGNQLEEAYYYATKDELLKWEEILKYQKCKSIENEKL